MPSGGDGTGDHCRSARSWRDVISESDRASGFGGRAATAVVGVPMLYTGNAVTNPWPCNKNNRGHDHGDFNTTQPGTWDTAKYFR